MKEESTYTDTVCLELLKREDGTTMPALRDLSGRETEALALDRLFMPGTPASGWFANLGFAGRPYLVSVSIDPATDEESPAKRPRLLWTVEGELNDPLAGDGIGYLQHAREQSPGIYALDRLSAVPTDNHPEPWKNYAPHDMSKGYVAPGVHFTSGKLLPVLIIFHPATDRKGPHFTIAPFSSGLPNNSLLPPTPRRDTFDWDIPELPDGVLAGNFRLSRTWRRGRPPEVEFDGAVQAGLTYKYSQRAIGGAVATAREGDVDNWCVRAKHRASTVFSKPPRITG